MLYKFLNLLGCSVAAFLVHWLVVYIFREIYFALWIPKWIRYSLSPLRAIFRLGIIGAFCVFGVGPFFKQNFTLLISLMQQKVGVEETYLLVAAIVTLFGFAAFYFKKWNKRLYGEVEVLVGIITAFLVAQSMNGRYIDLAKWSTLAGAAYVIARGLGNRSDAMSPYRNGTWQPPPSLFKPN